MISFVQLLHNQRLKSNRKTSEDSDGITVSSCKLQVRNNQNLGIHTIFSISVEA